MIKKMESKEYALGVERMDKEVGAPIDIAQSPMLMAAYEAGWDGANLPSIINIRIHFTMTG